MFLLQNHRLWDWRTHKHLSHLSFRSPEGLKNLQKKFQANLRIKVMEFRYHNTSSGHIKSLHTIRIFCLHILFRFSICSLSPQRYVFTCAIRFHIHILNFDKLSLKIMKKISWKLKFTLPWILRCASTHSLTRCGGHSKYVLNLFDRSCFHKMKAVCKS